MRVRSSSLARGVVLAGVVPVLSGCIVAFPWGRVHERDLAAVLAQPRLPAVVCRVDVGYPGREHFGDESLVRRVLRQAFSACHDRSMGEVPADFDGPELSISLTRSPRDAWFAFLWGSLSVASLGAIPSYVVIDHRLVVFVECDGREGKRYEYEDTTTRWVGLLFMPISYPYDASVVSDELVQNLLAQWLVDLRIDWGEAVLEREER